jgi:DNA-directed RNA polymerase subunit RPC12/RpoP
VPSIDNIETVRDALAYEAGFEAQCRSCGHRAAVPSTRLHEPRFAGGIAGLGYQLRCTRCGRKTGAIITVTLPDGQTRTY